MLKRELVRGIVISNTCVKLYRNWIINEVARAGEHTNERTYVRTYVLTYIRTEQTLYPLHNFVLPLDNKPCIWGFQIMKNNIKKAPVKFWEDLLYFQHFMQIFVFAPN